MEPPSHNSPHDSVLGVAVRAAHRGAEIIRDHAGRLDEVREKGINDFVTATDEAAQAAIVETLRDATPDAEVIAEEGANLDAHTPAIEGRRWIVDPLDGTTNFMQQVPPYAVSVALQQDDAVVVGVVLDVTHDELFTAVADHGLKLNGQPASVTQTSDFADAFIATGFPYRRFEHTEPYLDVLETVIRNTRGVRRHGSAAVDLARLACGRFDGFFETGLRPWDVAAGTLLVREGGGRVTDYHAHGGLTPLFDQQVCATNGTLHDTLLDTVASMKDVRL
ncbi:MAG TPA: inositol monophosphatase family protein [Salinibacter sp.]|nr:inositol monophosphatase family protein [Salinibacter sp.]